MGSEVCIRDRMRNVKTTQVNTSEERIVQRVQEMEDWRERKEERTTPRRKGCNMKLIFEEGRWEEKIQEESTEESEEEHDNGSEEASRTKKKARKEATEAARRRCNKECSQEMQSVDDKWTICRRACQRTKGHEKEKGGTGCDCTLEHYDFLMIVIKNGGGHNLYGSEGPVWLEEIEAAMTERWYKDNNKRWERVVEQLTSKTYLENGQDAYIYSNSSPKI